MNTKIPTLQEIEELVAFLPRLYAEGLTPIKRWGGGIDDDGILNIPWPEYDEIVDVFFQVASGECWTDYEYRPEEAGRMLMNHDAIKTADLAQIKTMLTFCVSGERFCSGHWGVMIEAGHVRRLLERLAELGAKNDENPAVPDLG
jgi:hypothetical protein